MRVARALLALLIVGPGLLGAQAPLPAGKDPRASLLVSTEWLATHLKDANLVLLHVGDAKDYPAAHIAGARLVSTQDVSVSDRSAGGLVMEMPSPDTLRARLAALGISDGSRIILYYGNDWVSPATRILELGKSRTRCGCGEPALHGGGPEGTERGS